MINSNEDKKQCRCKKGNGVARNSNEPIFDKENRDIKSIINQRDYHNKVDIDSLMNYGRR